MMLTGIALFTVVGVAFAFTANRATKVIYCDTAATGTRTCTVLKTNITTSGTTTVANPCPNGKYELSANPNGACSLNVPTFYTTTD